MSLEWVWRFSKLSPNSLQTHMFSFFAFFFLFTFFWKEEWIWKSLQTHSKLICFIFLYFFILTFFLKRGMGLEWVWRFSKLSPNSCVFISLLFTFFGQEEWVWSEFGDSPNWLQIRSKLICFHVFSFLPFFGKRGMSLEWVWRFSKLSPNSTPNSNDLMIYCVFPLLFFHFCSEKTNDFGVSLEILQTLSKLAPNSYVFRFFCFCLFFSIYYLLCFFGKRGMSFGMSLEWVWGFSKLTPNSNDFYFFSVCFPFIVILNIFWGREEWVWSKFGGSSNSLQTYSKLAPNSYGFILLFLLYCQFIVFFIFLKKEWVFIFSVIFTGCFLKKKEWIWRFPKVFLISLRALVATPLGPEITYCGRCFIGTYQINLVNAYHPERLSSCKLSVCDHTFGRLFPQETAEPCDMESPDLKSQVAAFQRNPPILEIRMWHSWKPGFRVEHSLKKNHIDQRGSLFWCFESSDHKQDRVKKTENHWKIGRKNVQPDTQMLGWEGGGNREIHPVADWSHVFFLKLSIVCR